MASPPRSRKRTPRLATSISAMRQQRTRLPQRAKNPRAALSPNGASRLAEGEKPGSNILSQDCEEARPALPAAASVRRQELARSPCASSRHFRSRLSNTVRDLICGGPRLSGPSARRSPGRHRLRNRLRRFVALMSRWTPPEAWRCSPLSQPEGSDVCAAKLETLRVGESVALGRIRGLTIHHIQTYDQPLVNVYVF
jgi:hypothetical protein